MNSNNVRKWTGSKPNTYTKCLECQSPFSQFCELSFHRRQEGAVQRIGTPQPQRRPQAFDKRPRKYPKVSYIKNQLSNVSRNSAAAQASMLTAGNSNPTYAVQDVYGRPADFQLQVGSYPVPPFANATATQMGMLWAGDPNPYTVENVFVSPDNPQPYYALVQANFDTQTQLGAAAAPGLSYSPAVNTTTGGSVNMASNGGNSALNIDQGSMPTIPGNENLSICTSNQSQLGYPPALDLGASLDNADAFTAALVNQVTSDASATRNAAPAQPQGSTIHLTHNNPTPVGAETPGAITAPSQAITTPSQEPANQQPTLATSQLQWYAEELDRYKEKVRANSEEARLLRAELKMQSQAPSWSEIARYKHELESYRDRFLAVNEEARLLRAQLEVAAEEIRGLEEQIAKLTAAPMPMCT
ncbi:hypothetical protein BDW74DRAFT_175220 [Aspergillus multicolor]|uniref:uncharacterized protein n=1 Tax=Aspergillus multicolor TaxID=41759 RepID=UPI003CCCD6BB